jgi:uncharacterized phage-associated protein
VTRALYLAEWIRGRFAHPLTHLKLQKLCFYCYGAALAFECKGVGSIEFQAWKHGPVNLDVWNKYREFGSAPVAPPEFRHDGYENHTFGVLDCALKIYGRLTAWQIREESHLEGPWARAFAEQRAIAEDELRAHFTQKFRGQSVALPANLVGSSSLSLDRIPVHRYPSFADMAEAVSRIR